MPPVNSDQPHKALGPRKQQQQIPLKGNGEPIVPPKKKSAMPKALVTSTKNTQTSSSSRKTTEEPSSAVEQRQRSVEIEEVDDPENHSNARSKAPRNSQRVLELSDDEDFMDVDNNPAPEVREQPEENDEEELSEQYYSLI
jgi:hypothetical protein